MSGPLTFEVSSLIISVVYVNCFEFGFSHKSYVLVTETMTLGSTDLTARNHDYACEGIKLSLCVRPYPLIAVYIEGSPLAPTRPTGLDASGYSISQ